MTEIQTEQSEVKAPAKRKTKKRKAKAASPKPAKEASPFAGITAKTCPAACTADKCVISTVGVCAHPYKSATSGFGPKTLQNRDQARKLIKHQMVDLKG